MRQFDVASNRSSQEGVQRTLERVRHHRHLDLDLVVVARARSTCVGLFFTWPLEMQIGRYWRSLRNLEVMPLREAKPTVAVEQGGAAAGLDLAIILVAYVRLRHTLLFDPDATAFDASRVVLVLPARIEKTVWNGRVC